MSVPPRLAPCDVVGVGANSVDYVNRIPSYPSPNGSFSKMRIQEQAICCGGQTATALSTCVSLGLTARYVGATGTDENGKRIRAEMTARGIDMSEAVIRDGPNQFALIIVDEQTGERIVLWDRDEHLNITAAEIDPALIAAARVVHVDDEDQDAASAAAPPGLCAPSKRSRPALSGRPRCRAVSSPSLIASSEIANSFASSSATATATCAFSIW